jgi:hypothetical protein
VGFGTAVSFSKEEERRKEREEKEKEETDEEEEEEEAEREKEEEESDDKGEEEKSEAEDDKSNKSSFLISSLAVFNPRERETFLNLSPVLNILFLLLGIDLSALQMFIMNDLIYE